MTPADLPACDAVMTAAYGPGPRLSRLTRYLAVEPGGWLVACEGGESGPVVAMGGALLYPGVAYLGLMAVLPSHQRRGLGEAVFLRVLALAAAAGCGTVLLDASAAGMPLYLRHGFTVDEETQVCQAPPGLGVPPPSDVLPWGAVDLPEIAAFDAVAFGADRSAMLGAYARAHPNGLWACRSPAGDLLGYAVVQDHAVGPVVAETSEVAERLLRVAPRPLPVAIPGSNAAGLALLQRLGFTHVRHVAHMRLGGDGPPGVPSRIFARASFVAG